MQNETIITIHLPLNQVQVILNSLASGPFNVVAPIITSVKDQATIQLQAPTEEEPVKKAKTKVEAE